MTRWKSEAVVLRHGPEGESDLRVMLMTPGQGRIWALAKGALRSHKRFAGVFETGRVINAGFMTAPRSGRAMLEHADVQEPLAGLRGRPAALARAGLLIEIVSLTAGEGEPAPALYALLKNGLIKIGRQPDHDRWSVAFAYRLLAEAGYRPSLDCCVHCRGPVPKDGAMFNPAGGGTVCPNCLRLPFQATNISARECMEAAPDTVRTLSTLLDLPPEQLHRVNFTRRSLRQARAMLAPFIAFHLGQPSASLKLLAEMGPARSRPQPG